MVGHDLYKKREPWPDMNNLEQHVNWVCKLLTHSGEYANLEADHGTYLPDLDANMARHVSSLIS